MLIKIENNVPVGYPLVEENFKQLFPAEVFPLVLTNEIVGPFGYAMYDFSQIPEVRWDQKLIESTPISDQYGIWRQTWVVEELPSDELGARIAAAALENVRRIDSDVDSIYGAVIGNRGLEYQQAEADAQSFAKEGYAGAAPSSVAVWATVKGWTEKQAADDILTEATQWRAAQAAIRAQRLQSKGHVRVASTVSAMNAAMDAWKQFTVAIRAQLDV